MHPSFKIGHPVATIFNDFPEIVSAREITTKNREDFFSSVAVGLFLEWAYSAASTAPTLIRLNP